MSEKSRVVVLLSGGLDSSTCAYEMSAQGYDVFAIGFNYGQKHGKELIAARTIAGRVAEEYREVHLESLSNLLKSALTDPDTGIPSGHYAEENMKQTVVPNRNAIMLSIAYGWAVSLNAEVVATGVHAGDHFIYPDCRPQFIKAFDLMAGLANEGFGNPQLHVVAPFMHMTKSEIVTVGVKHGVPYRNTWSCYRGDPYHCGQCGTCVERKEAFRLAGVVDPTVYEDPDYAISAYRG